MITVTIAINGHVIYARSAVNVTENHGGKYAIGKQFYKVDNGEIVKHPYGDIKGLVHKLVDTIET